MKKFSLILTCLFLGAALWGQGPKRALTFEDMFATGRLSSPVVSPDGKWVVFAVKTPDLAANTFQTDLYATDLQGRTLTKLTDGKGSNSGPRFLKSGLLTFVSTRGGDPQVYSLEMFRPGAIKAVTSVPGGVGDFIWLSDGKAIAFARDVDPKAKTFAEALAMEKAAAGNKATGKELTALMFRVWDSWRDGKRSHVFRHLPGSDEFTDLTPGDFDTPPLDLGGGQDYLFSPDGAWFAYVKNTDPVVAISTNNDVYLRSLKERPGKERQRRQPGRRRQPGLFAEKQLPGLPVHAPRRFRGRQKGHHPLRPEDRETPQPHRRLPQHHRLLRVRRRREGHLFHRLGKHLRADLQAASGLAEDREDRARRSTPLP